MALKRAISPFNLFLIAISGIIGSGWLFSPFYAAKFAGPAAILSWGIGFIIIFVIALPFAEMASKFPVAGGIVHFSRVSHGRPLSFLVSWANWLAFVAIAPIEVQATLQYSSHFFPSLIEIMSDGTRELTQNGLMCALVLMMLFTFMNLYGVRLAAKINRYIALWKIVVPIILLIVLFSFQFNSSNLTHAEFMPMGIKGVLTAVASGGVVFSFIGFRAAVELSAEAEKPNRSIPIALLGSLLFCFVLYALLQLAFIGAVLPKNFVSGWMHLSFQNRGGPLLDVVATVGIIWLLGLIYIDSIISPMGAGMVSNTSSARIVYAMGENRYIPAWFKATNEHSVPHHALWFNFIIGMLFFFPFSGWQQLMSIMVDASLVAYMVGAVCVIAIRRLYLTSSSANPFIMPGGVVTGWLAFYFGTLVLYWSGFSIVWHLVVGMLLGLVALLVVQYRREKQLLVGWSHMVWLLVYLACLFVFSALGIYGGKGWLPMGWDFIALAVWSLLMYGFALVSRLDQPYIDHIPRQVA